MALTVKKGVLGHQTIIIEQLYTLVSDCGKLTSRLQRAWLQESDSWSSSFLWAQIERLAESEACLELEKAYKLSGIAVCCAGFACVTIVLNFSASTASKKDRIAR